MLSVTGSISGDKGIGHWEQLDRLFPRYLSGQRWILIRLSGTVRFFVFGPVAFPSLATGQKSSDSRNFNRPACALTLVAILVSVGPLPVRGLAIPPFTPLFLCDARLRLLGPFFWRLAFFGIRSFYFS